MVAAKRKLPKKQSSLPVVDGDLARLQILLTKKQEYVAILKLELTNTRADLNSFTQVYNQHIMPLHRRANNLRKLLYEELEKQREHDKDKWPEFPGADEAADKAENDAHIPDDDPLNEHSGRKMNSAASNGKQLHIDPKREQRIRDLFRKLAKRFHPDLTADPDEKVSRELIMAQVNLAYTSRDLEALQKLEETPDIAKVNGSLSQAKLIAHIRVELERLDLVITELETTIRQIDTSPIMQLRLETHMARSDGKELLTDMSSDLEVQIKDLEEHLIVLGVEIEAEPLE